MSKKQEKMVNCDIHSKQYNIAIKIDVQKHYAITEKCLYIRA